MLGLDRNQKLKLVEQDDVILNSTLTSPVMILEIPSAAYFDSISETKRIRQEMSTLFNDQDNDFDKNNSTNVKEIRVNRNPLLDEEIPKNFLETEVDKNTIPRDNHTLQNYLKVSVANIGCSLTKIDRKENKRYNN